MATIERLLPAPQDAVFRALVTPETYPVWLVGCQDVRDVDDGWPKVGTAFHHRVGLGGPLVVADHTRVLDVAAPHRLVLEARFRPVGRARVTFTVVPAGDDRASVTFDEVPLGRLAPLRPVLDLLTAGRNATSLARLADLLVADRHLREGAAAR